MIAKGLLNQEQGAGKTDPKGQENVDLYIANGLRVVHDQSVSDGIVSRVKGSKTPTTAIADETLNIVERLDKSAQQNGKGVPLDYLAQVGNVIMGEIIEVVEAAGAAKLSDEDRYQAFSIALSKYIAKGVSSGRISQEQLAQYSQQAQATPEGQKIAQQLQGQAPEPQQAQQPAKEGA